MAGGKGGGSFWPAYVDLMTVLLMVFVLLTLLFQTLAALARMKQGVMLNQSTSMVTDVVAKDHGALTLTFDRGATLSLNQTLEASAWFGLKRGAIQKEGATLIALSPTEEQGAGGRMTGQFERVMDIKRIAQGIELGDKLTIVNRVQGDIPENEQRVVLMVGQHE